MIFEQRLQQALEESGMSQAELGRRVGVNSQSVSGWCSGIFPRKDKLEMLPAVLGKPLYWFFLSEDEEKGLTLSENNHSLTEKHMELINLFEQLPTNEQENMIAAFSARLKELDSFVEQYLQRRKPTSSD
ncbi:transcriptional repressor DicA [Serratia quinivorans]|uniref:helix-turn-helix domain-containing protein n=1 Tax=Serratia quinivorans TaxID=137545 RepID=UPI00217A34BF|nr:helix-turn-helix domain-containing protein [Serratia quinivorans]CAI1788651.1 transcriptional repressor DicA [Serratia quinivorans]